MAVEEQEWRRSDAETTPQRRRTTTISFRIATSWIDGGWLAATPSGRDRSHACSNGAISSRAERILRPRWYSSHSLLLSSTSITKATQDDSQNHRGPSAYYHLRRLSSCRMGFPTANPPTVRVLLPWAMWRHRFSKAWSNTVVNLIRLEHKNWGFAISIDSSALSMYLSSSPSTSRFTHINHQTTRRRHSQPSCTCTPPASIRSLAPRCFSPLSATHNRWPLNRQAIF